VFLFLKTRKEKKRLKEKGREWINAESVEIKIWMWMNVWILYVCIYNVTEYQLTCNRKSECGWM
jgi:hypothetical protein